MTQTNKKLLQEELLELLEAKEQAVKYRKIDTLFPNKGPFRREYYPKHIEFFNRGSQHSQRAFIAANRTGKTLAGAFEVACHLTGEYPKWWAGRKFLNAVDFWASGVSNQSTKEIQQFELLGDLSDIGTGTIPKEHIIKVTKKPGVADAVETVFVKHRSGGTSKCTFKSYEQGRDSFQGTKKQGIWLDEEPKDRGIFTECLTRTMDKYNPGIIICTFTPLFGLSDVVMSFLPDGKLPVGGIDPNAPYKFVTQVSWEEVPHLDEKQKAEILATYSVHERAARSKGIPSLGAGAIYPYCEDEIVVSPFAIPSFWPKVYGMDVGWNRTAAVFLAMNPDTRQVYVYSEHYQGAAEPIVHATAIKARGDWLIGAVDPASKGKSQVDGRQLFNLYEECGLLLEVADNSPEAGILKVGQMFIAGQLKIFSTCTNLIEEYRVYRRDENGKIVKKKDHALDALRYAIMTGMDLFSIAPDPDYKEESSVDDTGRDKFTGY